MITDSAVEVLQHLADGHLHSGERLAAQLGISRAALAKRMDKLREWGVEIPAQAGLGYQLAQPLELLSACQIQAQLSVAKPLQLAVLARTDSTNNQLLATPAHADPQVLFAESQTAGRGRRGRSWQSPFAANITFSVAWSFPFWPARITTLPLAVAVVLCRALQQLGLAHAQIKWPNDIHINGKKLAGILIEPRGEANGACRVIIGVGLNVAMTPAQASGVDQPWTALAAEWSAAKQNGVGRNRIAAVVLDALLAALAHYQDYGFTPFAHEWAQRDALAGRAIQVVGAEPITGVAAGIDADGGLRVQLASGGVTVIHAGEVSVRPL